MDAETTRGRRLVLTLILAYGAGAWLALTHHGLPGTRAELGALGAEAFWTGTVALLLVQFAVELASRAIGASQARSAQVSLVAVAAASVLTAVSAAGQTVFSALPAPVPVPTLVLREFVVALAACVALAALAVLERWSPPQMGDDADRSPRARPVSTRGRRGAATAALAALAVAAASAAPVSAVPMAPVQVAAAAAGVCASATRTITYDVEAMSVDLPLNGWGDHVPDGMIYALRNDDALISAEDIRQKPGRATPLVLRAAVGDCIKVKLTNSIRGKRVGMHVDGIAKEVTGPNASDGANIGFNTDSTVAYQDERTYTWYAGREGQFVINDYGSGTDFARTEPTQDTTSKGLYGALIVLEKGATWHDPQTEQNLLSDDGRGLGAPVYADVRLPGRGDDYRDVALLFVDEPQGVLDKTDNPPTFPHTGVVDASFGFNYRVEALRNRLKAVIAHRERETVTLPNGTVILPDDKFCDGWTTDQSDEENLARLAKDKGISSCHGEESHLQSWPFGDPGVLTEAVNETDVLEVKDAGGGTFTLKLTDPTVNRSFEGERYTTDPIPFDASPAQVQAALLALTVLPMADLAPGDITVTGAADGRYSIAFAQHFAGRDVELTVDGGGLQPVPVEDPIQQTSEPVPPEPAATESTGQTSTDPSEPTSEPVPSEPSAAEESMQPVAPSASVSDMSPGGTKGRIDVLSDALIPHAYRGDPVHVRIIHPGVKETHPFHQHTNRWRQESEDPNSTRLDVQSISPGQTAELVYEGGAGEAITADPDTPELGTKSAAEWLEAGKPDLAALAVSKASNGDQIFHCHLYPHFAQGFWGMLRVYDRQRPVDPAKWPADVSRTYPDGTPMAPLALLPDLDLTALHPVTETPVPLTPMPDAAHPGFPLFVKGEYGQRAYRPPGAVVADQFETGNWRRPGDTVRGYDSGFTTDLERNNMVTTADKKAIPGSFFIDPCPAGVPTRHYYPAAVDAKIVYNKAGWHDPNGKLYIEAPPSDPNDPGTAIGVAAAIRTKIEAGDVATEPYNMRANLGDCVIMQTTNATHLDNDDKVPADVHDGQFDDDGAHGMTGSNAFHLPTLMSELSTHVHLVRFDELGTDGTSVGWNYVQAPMVGQTYSYRWFVDVPLRTVYFHDHQNPNTHQQHGLWAAMNVEPASSTWHSSTNGELLTPDYCDGLTLPGPGTGDPACYGVGAVADIRVPGSVSFREFTVNYSDFVPLYDAAGEPINPPGQPDDYATDQGGMAINYRNEPFPIRVNSSTTGVRNEPAYIFSSAVHGDPSTPLFRAYPGDPVIFRFMGGAHEEGHNFTLAGHRWLHEPDDPNSNLYDSQFVMISEFFNFEVSGSQVIERGTKDQAVERAREAGITDDSGGAKILPTGAGAPGDYLYSSQPLNDLWLGMWGIFRVQAARTPDLQPLPGRTAPAAAKNGSQWPAVKPGEPLRPPLDNPKPCPNTAVQRTYNISLVNTRIDYNGNGDHDPNGVAYVLDQELDSTGRPKAGTKIKPLFIRAVENECLNLVLTNRLPQAGISLGDGDPVNPVEAIGTDGTSHVTNLVDGRRETVTPSWPAGNRASIHPSGLIRYSVIAGDGSAVGYNFDSTAGPGQEYTYKYLVDSKNIGVANLADWGNLRTTRHHGAWGALIAEPKGATFLNPRDLATLPNAAGEQAVVRYTDASGKVRAYREFVVDIQDGLNLFDEAGQPIRDLFADENEDMGEVGINYRTEPFDRRLVAGGDIADVLSSRVFGDPATPVFRAYKNEPVMMRILNSQDLPRVHTFGMSGHAWRYEQNDPNSNIVTSQGGLNTGRAFNAGICAGSVTPMENLSGTAECTGTDAVAGDFLYNDRNFFHMFSGGAWGLVRVHDTAQADLKPLSGLTTSTLEKNTPKKK